MSLLRRRMMCKQDDGEYVTSIDGERIKLLQVVPKEFDPNNLSIRDEVYEENGKKYLKKQVRGDVTGEILIPDLRTGIAINPFVTWRKATSYDCFGDNDQRYYSNCMMWIDGTEVMGWNTSEVPKRYTDSVGIKTYVSSFDGGFRVINYNNFTVDEVQKILSNKPFYYAVPEEETEIIEIR